MLGSSMAGVLPVPCLAPGPAVAPKVETASLRTGGPEDGDVDVSLRPASQNGANHSETTRPGWSARSAEGSEGTGASHHDSDAAEAEGGGAGGEELEDEDVERDVNMKVERPLTAAEVAAGLRTVQGMWEMAAVLDFLTLFKPQLRLSRELGADELEHVLVTSAGDGGLLADLHADLLRGISPKSVIDPGNWVVHLANKIKFHWKGAPGGEPCPFRPEKYFEAVTYAGLPVEQRVKALHFVCCVRLDREDCQARIEEALRPRTRKELAAIEAAKEAAAAARPTRGSRAAAAAFQPPEDVDSFRREAIGAEASGISYYYLTGEMGSRLFRDIPAELARRQGPGGADRGQGSGEEESGPEADFAERKGGKKRRGRAAAYVVPPAPAPGAWELLATTVPQMESIGERLHRSMKPQDKAVGRVILEDLVPRLQERQAAEAKRLKATERVARRLGEPSLYGDEPGGRSRRERRAVNYAFTDYDDMLRSAIRRSQRSGETGDEFLEEGRRGKRGASPVRLDPAVEAQMGLRRGRSVAGHHSGAEEVPEINERALRQAAAAQKAEEEAAAIRAAEQAAEEAARAEEEAARAAEEAAARAVEEAARAAEEAAARAKAEAAARAAAERARAEKRKREAARREERERAAAQGPPAPFQVERPAPLRVRLPVPAHLQDGAHPAVYAPAAAEQYPGVWGGGAAPWQSAGHGPAQPYASPQQYAPAQQYASAQQYAPAPVQYDPQRYLGMAQAIAAAGAAEQRHAFQPLAWAPDAQVPQPAPQQAGAVPGQGAAAQHAQHAAHGPSYAWRGPPPQQR
ncbi:hypothetical protein ACKKBG_A35950 [Auxenochlorella protothecoides x Auxenochlorella symbiontica]